MIVIKKEDLEQKLKEVNSNCITHTHNGMNVKLFTESDIEDIPSFEAVPLANIYEAFKLIDAEIVKLSEFSENRIILGMNKAKTCLMKYINKE